MRSNQFYYTPITEDRVLYHGQDAQRHYPLSVFDVVKNQHLVDLKFEDYPFDWNYDFKILSSRNQKTFVIVYLMQDRTNYSRFTVFKIFDTETLTCQRTHKLEKAGYLSTTILHEGDFIATGREIVPRLPCTKHLCLKQQDVIAKFRNEESKLVPKRILSTPFSQTHPLDFRELKPNLLAEMRETGIILYDIAARVVHPCTFSSILPKTVKLPREKHRLGICYSPDGSQACLYYTDNESEQSYIEHLELTTTWRGYYTYRHRGSYSFPNHECCVLFWTETDILYALYFLRGESKFTHQLVTLDPYNQFQKTPLQTFFDVKPGLIFTPYGRVIEWYPNKFKLYECQPPECMDRLSQTVQTAAPQLPAPLTRLVTKYVGYDPRMFSVRQVIKPDPKEKSRLSAPLLTP